MKTLILAGGYGTRLSEETGLRPKPMVEIGQKPILWHIMKIYAHFGCQDFIILCGYKGHLIKEYFANYFLYHTDITFDLRNNSMEIHRNNGENWRVTCLDTGLDTMTGGRILRAKPYLDDNEPFMLTYGDGLSDIDINQLRAFHEKHNGMITLTSTQPEGRFGALDIGETGRVKTFTEKPKGDGAWINAGFYVCEPDVLEYIRQGDQTVFERAPLENLASDGQLYTYQHRGFWHPMDTLRDKQTLDGLWERGEAKWNVWNREYSQAL